MVKFCFLEIPCMSESHLTKLIAWAAASPEDWLGSYLQKPVHPKFTYLWFNIVTAEMWRDIKKFIAARCRLPSTHTHVPPPHYEPMSPLFHSEQAIQTDAVMSCCLFGYRLSQMTHDAVTQISAAPLALNHHLSLSPPHVWSKASFQTISALSLA